MDIAFVMHRLKEKYFFIGDVSGEYTDQGEKTAITAILFHLFFQLTDPVSY
jgi:hypothetical protein